MVRYLWMLSIGAFTLANFARDFALSLHVLLNKNYLFSLLNVQASAKSCAKLRQCKHTLRLISMVRYLWLDIYGQISMVRYLWSDIYG